MPPIDTYELGQARPPANGWLASDWGHFSNIMDWSADNVRPDAGGVRIVLDEAGPGAAEPYEGGEIQSDATATAGTFSWTAQAPDLASGAIFGLFTFQEDYRDPRCEFDFEFVRGDTRRVVVVVHMAGPDGQRVSSQGRTIDLGFDAAAGFHDYQVVVTAHGEAAFRVDGAVVAYFSAADMPGGAWDLREMRSYANLWATDGTWAGGWDGLDKPMVGTVRRAGVQPGVFDGVAQVDGTDGADVLNGSAGADIVRGRSGDDVLRGGGGRDFLRGQAGRDTLDGGAGADRLEGGIGSDTYVVAAPGDTVVELAGGGLDEVRAAVGHALAANVETLVLTGRAGINGTGNAGANLLAGNAGSNRLDGGAGADRLYGGAGHDGLAGGTGGDTLVGGTGVDRLDGGAGADMLAGGPSTDGLMGGAGSDALMGGTGNDRLMGGLGDDRLWGNGGGDAFYFGAGRDVAKDFRDDVDTLFFDDALWGGGGRTASGILAFARMEGRTAVFDFGNGRVLRVEGAGTLDALGDDVGWF